MNPIRRADLIGLWRMVSWVQHRGSEEVLPMGAAPVGFLLYTEGGIMSVHVMRRDRPAMTTGDFVTGSEAEKAVAFSSYLGYTGTFDVQDGVITHNIQCCSFPNWTGQAQMRTPRWDGEFLVFEAAPRLVDSVSVTASLTWKKEKA